jgi:glutaredoxin
MQIEIYGAPWCGYCQQAKRLCEENNVDFIYIDVDDTEQLRKLEARLGAPARAIPQIFLDNNLISTGFNGLKEAIKNIQ